MNALKVIHALRKQRRSYEFLKTSSITAIDSMIATEVLEVLTLIEDDIFDEGEVEERLEHEACRGDGWTHLTSDSDLEETDGGGQIV